MLRMPWAKLQRLKPPRTFWWSWLELSLTTSEIVPTSAHSGWRVNVNAGRSARIDMRNQQIQMIHFPIRIFGIVTMERMILWQISSSVVPPQCPPSPHPRIGASPPFMLGIWESSWQRRIYGTTFISLERFGTSRLFRSNSALLYNLRIDQQPRLLQRRVLTSWSCWDVGWPYVGASLRQSKHLLL